MVFVNSDNYKGGLFLLKDNLIENIAQHRRSSANFFNTADSSLESSLRVVIKGRSLFLGYIFSHFGHFIYESVPYLRHINYSDYDNLIAYNIGAPNYSEDSYQSLILSAYGIKLLNVKFISAPVRIDSLDILSQRFGFYSRSIFDAGVLSDFVVAVAQLIKKIYDVDKRTKSKSFKKIYVSKKKIGPIGSYLEESYIESILANEGFSVLYPEELTLLEQLEYYLNAETLFFCEGSAIHTLLFLNIKNKRIFYISRRGGLSWIFDGQLKSQEALEYKGISCVEKNISISRNEWEDISCIDINLLLLQMHSLRLISTRPIMDKEALAKVRENCFHDSVANIFNVLKKRFS